MHHEVAHNVADDGHTVFKTVARDVAEVGADSTSATVACNVAHSNFSGHMVKLSSCAQCCTVCPGLNFEWIVLKVFLSLNYGK